MLPVPFFTFLMVQFIRGIPSELDEAAEIDGCSKFGTFFKIILPNLKPVLVTAGIFRFYWSWNDFMTPLLYLQNVTKYPVSIALKMFSDPNAVTNWGAMFAMTFLSILPTMIIFIFFQRYLIDGVSFSGLKG
jgi:multiple sugar transport system permease protein